MTTDLPDLKQFPYYHTIPLGSSIHHQDCAPYFLLPPPWSLSSYHTAPLHLDPQQKMHGRRLTTELNLIPTGHRKIAYETIHLPAILSTGLAIELSYRPTLVRRVGALAFSR